MSKRYAVLRIWLDGATVAAARRLSIKFWRVRSAAAAPVFKRQNWHAVETKVLARTPAPSRSDWL